MKILQHISLYLIAISYLLISTGFGLKVHYCHGDITSISYIVSSPICACDDGLSDMTCCNTEEKFYQLQEETLPQFQSSIDLNLFPLISTLYQEGDQEIRKALDLELIEIVDIHPPPIYLIKSSFIFYG